MECSMLRLWAWWPWAESPKKATSTRMAVFIPTGCRPSATMSSHYAPLMAGRSARRDACQSKNLYCLPTAGFPHCSLFTLSLFLGGKWAEGPMVCSPGQSDRRERRPGCMPIYLAAATRQWVYHGSSSYHVPPYLRRHSLRSLCRRVAGATTNTLHSLIV